MRQKKKNDLLTDVELEFMSHLWALGQGTVRDVLAKLAPGRNLAYRPSTLEGAFSDKFHISSSD